MKKSISLLLTLILVLGLAACNSNKPESSTPESGADSEEGDVFELSIETYFNGTKENEDGETLGIYAYMLWYGDRVEYQISEYASEFSNVVYHQEGIAYYPEDEDDETTIIERTEDDPGTIELRLEGNTMIYKIIRKDSEDEFVLDVLTEDEARKLK